MIDDDRVNQVKILNTVICYDNVNEVLDYIQKLQRLEFSNYIAVCVVINKLQIFNEEELIDGINKLSICCMVVNPKKNLGYMNGMIFGYEVFVKKYNLILDYVVMSNTDINYPDIGFYKKLLTNTYDDSIWGIGPAVYSTNSKSYTNPILFSRRTKQRVKYTIRIFKTPLINLFYIWASNLKTKIKKQKIGKSGLVYEVHGCFFIVKPQLVNEMIKKPFGALLYSEEAYVAEMIYHLGKKEYYDSELMVEHAEHSVTGRVKNKRIAKHIASSMAVILRDFYND